VQALELLAGKMAVKVEERRGGDEAAIHGKRIAGAGGNQGALLLNLSQQLADERHLVSIVQDALLDHKVERRRLAPIVVSDDVRFVTDHPVDLIEVDPDKDVVPV